MYTSLAYHGVNKNILNRQLYLIVQRELSGTCSCQEPTFKLGENYTRVTDIHT